MQGGTAPKRRRKSAPKGALPGGEGTTRARLLEAWTEHSHCQNLRSAQDCQCKKGSPYCLAGGNHILCVDYPIVLAWIDVRIQDTRTIEADCSALAIHFCRSLRKEHVRSREARTCYSYVSQLLEIDNTVNSAAFRLASSQSAIISLLQYGKLESRVMFRSTA